MGSNVAWVLESGLLHCDWCGWRSALRHGASSASFAARTASACSLNHHHQRHHHHSDSFECPARKNDEVICAQTNLAGRRCVAAWITARGLMSADVVSKHRLTEHHVREETRLLITYKKDLKKRVYPLLALSHTSEFICVWWD